MQRFPVENQRLIELAGKSPNADFAAFRRHLPRAVQQQVNENVFHCARIQLNQGQRIGQFGLQAYWIIQEVRLSRNDRILDEIVQIFGTELFAAIAGKFHQRVDNRVGALNGVGHIAQNHL